MSRDTPPVSVVSQCALNVWLSGWLAEISADLGEAVSGVTNQLGALRHIKIGGPLL